MTEQMAIDTLIILVALPAWLLMTALLWWAWTAVEAIVRRISRKKSAYRGGNRR
ncbi:MAG: hypothetical protein ACLSAP_04815 [Oscillospiraceae bacterium]